MRIVQLIPQLSSGGAERFVVDLSNDLSLRHDVVLIVSFALVGETSFYLPEVSERVEIISLNKKMGFDIRYLYHLYRVIKQKKIDVIHTHVEAFTHFALLKWLFPKVKFVHTVHTDAQFEAGGRVKAFLRNIFFKNKWCKAVTISAKSAVSFNEYYGANMEHTLIYNGRMLNVTPSSDILIPRVKGIYNFVSIGHISKIKNQMLMCKALTNLLNKGVTIELYMFGRYVDGAIVEQIKALNNPHIHMLGERENPMQYLENADVFCMSSLIEGMPISLIEALACGLIPICTNVGGIDNVVDDGKIGFLSPDLLVESYTKAIERFLSLSDNEVKAMKTLCIERSKLYSIEECARQYENLYGK